MKHRGYIMPLIAGLIFGGVVALMSGSSDEPSPQDVAPTEADIQKAATMMPKDQTLSDIYARSCKVCHSNAYTKAPLTGHKADWQNRLDQRRSDGLLNSAVEGFGAMPPAGLCPNCTPTQLALLICFMGEFECKASPSSNTTDQKSAWRQIKPSGPQ